ncbi:hypothetical protein C8R45DRAFT_1219622 [Mycena sanguinolenta]|nr:hypothetical protein C8R45DRAFT_1219622 [Mycena sanguinolenta]
MDGVGVYQGVPSTSSFPLLLLAQLLSHADTCHIYIHRCTPEILKSRTWLRRWCLDVGMRRALNLEHSRDRHLELHTASVE